MTIINVCNLFAPIVGPLIGIINILILILLELIALFNKCEVYTNVFLKIIKWSYFLYSKSSIIILYVLVSLQHVKLMGGKMGQNVSIIGH
jgi:hypothetical protein